VRVGEITNCVPAGCINGGYARGPSWRRATETKSVGGLRLSGGLGLPRGRWSRAAIAAQCRCLRRAARSPGSRREGRKGSGRRSQPCVCTGPVYRRCHAADRRVRVADHDVPPGGRGDLHHGGRACRESQRKPAEQAVVHSQRLSLAQGHRSEERDASRAEELDESRDRSQEDEQHRCQPAMGPAAASTSGSSALSSTSSHRRPAACGPFWPYSGPRAPEVRG